MNLFLRVSLYVLLCIGCFSIQSVQGQFRVVGYFNNWETGFLNNAKNVDYEKVTHLNVAFLNPNSSGDLLPTTNLKEVADFVHTKNRKILGSICGAIVQDTIWKRLLSTPTYRTYFINKIMQTVEDQHLDGIDVDIEGNLLNGLIITSEQYESFVVELGARLHDENKLMTAALASWFRQHVTNHAAKQFDWINVMAYDDYGTWTGPGQHSSYDNAVRDLNLWLPKVVDKSHLVLGVPSYGYLWRDNTMNNSSSLTYAHIASYYARASMQDSIVPWPTNVIYYNGIPTIKNKTALALSNASGIMMWTLQTDLPTSNPKSLLLAIDQVIQASLDNTPPVATLSSPADGSSYVEGDNISLSATATDENGSVTNLVFYAIKGTTQYTLSTLTSPPYTTNWVGASPGTYKVFSKAVDDAYTAGYSDTVTITITAPSTNRPIGNWNIPGKIEAENFDAGVNLGYYDSEGTNQGGAYRITAVDIEACSDVLGGYNIGYVAAGEWLKYTVNVAATGTYTFTTRVASNQTGNTFHLEVDGLNVTNAITVPSTNGWQNWQTVTYNNLPLTQGQHVVRLVFDTGVFNLNYIHFATATITSVHGSEASGSVTAAASPNPFNSSAKLVFSLVNGGQTKVVLNNVIGAAPVVLTDQYYAPGDYSLEIPGANLHTGIYFCTITCGEQSKVVKLIKQ